jgi:acyl dehydratase
MHTRWFEEFTVGETFTTRGATLTDPRILDLGLIERSNFVGPGLDEVRWLAPVRPGDTLVCVIEVLEARASRSKSDGGNVRFGIAAGNQDGVTVLTYQVLSIPRTRPEAALDEA